MFGNQSTLTGDYNIVIQDIKDSSIHISQNCFNEVPVELVVLTTKSENLQKNLPQIPTSYFQNRYGKDYKNWKPYENEDSISTLLEEYTEKSGFKLRKTAFDCSIAKIDEGLYEQLESLSNQTKEVIFIVDALSLVLAGNQVFAEKVFVSQYNIGGCVVPFCEKEPSEIRKIKWELLQKYLKRFYNFLKKYAPEYLAQMQDEGFLHIQLDVPNKNELFRILTSIILLHFENGKDWKETRRTKRSNRKILQENLQNIQLTSSI